MVWHMEWNLNDWLLRPAEAEEKGFQKRHLSLERQLPGAPWSPRRPVLAKTSIFTEKNTAKKLTLGDWRQHSVIFAFLWSYFQVLKSSLKKKKPIYSTVTWNIFCFLGVDLMLRWTENDMSALPLSVPMFSTLLHSQPEIKQPSRLMILKLCTQASFLICPPV